MPTPISFASVNRVFDVDGKCTDTDTESAVRSVAQTLTDYIHHHICPGITLKAMMRGAAPAH